MSFVRPFVVPLFISLSALAAIAYVSKLLGGDITRKVEGHMTERTHQLITALRNISDNGTPSRTSVQRFQDILTGASPWITKTAVERITGVSVDALLASLKDRVAERRAASSPAATIVSPPQFPPQLPIPPPFLPVMPSPQQLPPLPAFVSPPTTANTLSEPPSYFGVPLHLPNAQPQFPGGPIQFPGAYQQQPFIDPSIPLVYVN